MTGNARCPRFVFKFPLGKIRSSRIDVHQMLILPKKYINLFSIIRLSHVRWIYLLLRSASKGWFRDSVVVVGACCAQLATTRRCFIFCSSLSFPPASNYLKPPLSPLSPHLLPLSNSHTIGRITIAAPSTTLSRVFVWI